MSFFKSPTVSEGRHFTRTVISTQKNKRNRGMWMEMRCSQLDSLCGCRRKVTKRVTERRRGLGLAFTSETIVSDDLDHRPISHPVHSPQTNILSMSVSVSVDPYTRPRISSPYRSRIKSYCDSRRGRSNSSRRRFIPRLHSPQLLPTSISRIASPFVPFVPGRHSSKRFSACIMISP